jgi:tRNA nucleotidyltransferase/poly(A) polymerase
MHDIGKPDTKRFNSETGWTFYSHDELGSKMVRKVVKRMRLPENLGKYSEKLIKMHLRPIALSEEHVTDSAIRRFIVEADEYIDDLMILCRADITSGNPKRAKAHLLNFDRVVKRVEEVKEKDKLRAFQSPVNGNEIMEVYNLKPGKKVGIIKKMIEDAILNGTIPNDHDKAFEYLLKIKKDTLSDSD